MELLDEVKALRAEILHHDPHPLPAGLAVKLLDLVQKMLMRQSIPAAPSPVPQKNSPPPVSAAADVKGATFVAPLPNPPKASAPAPDTKKA